MSGRRWNVETRPDVFETVIAERFRVSSGAVVFLDDNDEPTVAYAAGSWITAGVDE